MKIEFSRQIFEKSSTTKFNENPFVGNELFHVDRWADMTKLIAAFRNFVNAPKNYQVFNLLIFLVKLKL